MKLQSILFIIFVFSLTSCTQLNKGVVIHATFDENGQDSGPNKYDAKLIGAEIKPESAVGNGAVYFDGTDDYVEFPSNKVYFNGNYSISIWCKPETGKTWERILDFNQDEPMSGNSVTWLVGRGARGQSPMWFDQWVFYEDIAVESILDQAATPPDAYLNYDLELNEWNHFVITYDAELPNSLGIQKNTKGENVPLEGIVTLYVNGKKVSTDEHCLKPQNKPTTANWLGRSRFAPDPYFKGFLDDFRLYDRALSEAEIEQLYQQKND
ncbi:MAG TPA: LamG domain-containing protein [Draconibacterium sp.]|nr:LamG domain-containing protein [Draconibacterium sp.]